MPASQILCLAAGRLAAWRFARGAPTVIRFGADDDGLRRFAEHVRAHRRDRFTLLVNLADEEFRIETLPALRGSDRAAVIARRQAQSFPGTPHVGCQSLGHERTRRREERVLLAALTAPERLAPWLAALRDAGAAVAGIQSLPFVAPRLLARIAPGDAATLLFTLQDDSLRESLVARGRLVFSRLVPLADDDADPLARIAAEAPALQRYLVGRGLLTGDGPPRLVAVVHPECLHARREIPAGLVLVAADDCARCAGLRDAPADGRIDAVHARLALAVRRPVQFADPALRHADRQRQLARGLRLIGTATLAASVAFAGHQTLAARDMDAAAAGLRADAEALRQQAAHRPPLPAGQAALHRIVERHDALRRELATPTAFYRDLGRILAQAPAIAVEAIDWQAATAGAGESATLRGTVDADAAAGAFDDLLAAIGDAPTLAVRVEQPPLPDGRGFVLRIVRRRGA